jgi:hypothetical protein
LGTSLCVVCRKLSGGTAALFCPQRPSCPSKQDRSRQICCNQGD